VRNIIKRWISRWLDRPESPSRFERWSEKNPSKPFKDFFSKTVERKLREGKGHESLGKTPYGDNYGVSGRAVLKYLVKLGLNPDDACVDYGCGTLRVGVVAGRFHVCDPSLKLAGLDIGAYERIVASCLHLRLGSQRDRNGFEP
jgi:hypothetical protein